MAETGKQSAQPPEKEIEKPDAPHSTANPEAQAEKDDVTHGPQTPEAQPHKPQAPHSAASPEAQAEKDDVTHGPQTPGAQPRKSQAPHGAEATEKHIKKSGISDDKKANEKWEFSPEELEILDEEALYNTALKLTKQPPTQAIGKSLEQISGVLNKRFSEDSEEKCRAFEAAGGDRIDFAYQNPWSKRFKDLISTYREKKAELSKQKDRELNQNLLLREQLTEELKELYQEPENIHTTFEKFNSIQKRWKQAGAIPHQYANRIFKTYYHHLENFYDYLDLNKAQREKDFENNLAEKEKIIARAEALLDEPDIYTASNELQHLHKMWKEEIGPVDKKHRESIWLRFKEATAKIHKRRHAYFQQRNEQQNKNLETKEAIMVKILTLTKSQPDSHTAWQAAMKTLQALRRELIDTGAVPQADRDRIREAFRTTCRSFTRKKDIFYNNIKKEQQENLKAKIALIELAAENREREDWDEAATFYKKLQKEWKHIGHVPKRKVNAIWDIFKSHCNYFFERYHNRNKRSEAESEALIAQKEKLIKALRGMALPEDAASALNTLQNLEEAWRKTGQLPGKTALDEKFQHLLNSHYHKLGLDEASIKLKKYQVAAAALSQDKDKLLEEMRFIKHKVNKLEKTLQQLENNLACFSGDTAGNPLLKQAEKNTEALQEELSLWRSKLNVLNKVSGPEKHG